MAEISTIRITGRNAYDIECLNIDVDAEQLPDGVNAFDATGQLTHFFECLDAGDWVIEIKDPNNTLRWQLSGIFYVQKFENEGGFVKEIEDQ